MTPDPPENPFEDVEAQAAEESERHLEMARALDGMEQDVTSWEADFLDSVLRQLQIRGVPLTTKQADILEEMYERYGPDRR